MKLVPIAGSIKAAFATLPQALARASLAGQEDQMVDAPIRPRRSVLYVPAANDKALARSASLPATPSSSIWRMR